MFGIRWGNNGDHFFDFILELNIKIRCIFDRVKEYFSKSKTKNIYYFFHLLWPIKYSNFLNIGKLIRGVMSSYNIWKQYILLDRHKIILILSEMKSNKTDSHPIIYVCIINLAHQYNLILFYSNK